MLLHLFCVFMSMHTSQCMLVEVREQNAGANSPLWHMEPRDPVWVSCFGGNCLSNWVLSLTPDFYVNHIFSASLSPASWPLTSQHPIPFSITRACSDDFPWLYFPTSPLHPKVHDFHAFGANLSPVWSENARINSLLLAKPHRDLLHSSVGSIII